MPYAARRRRAGERRRRGSAGSATSRRARAARARGAARRARTAERTVAAEQRQATVVMVTDTSGSMLAKDVQPDRLTAAKVAARALTDKLPRDFRLGLVGFGTAASQLVEPTTDKARVRVAIDSLKFAGKTAMGDGLSLAARGRALAGHRPRQRAPAAAARSDRAVVRRRQHRGLGPDHGRRARTEAAHPGLHGRARDRVRRASSTSAGTARSGARRCRPTPRRCRRSRARRAGASTQRPTPRS